MVMPARLALCDLGAPGWGEPWFPHSAVLLYSHPWYGFSGDVAVRVWFCFFAIPKLEMIQWYHLCTFYDVAKLASHFPSMLVFCLFVVLFCFVLRLVLLVLLWFWCCVSLWENDGSLDYASVLASSLLRLFILSNASWLWPGRLTRWIASRKKVKWLINALA